LTKTYELQPFLGEPMPVEFVSRMVGVEARDSCITLRCATDRHEPFMQNYYGTKVETAFAAPRAGEQVTVRVDICSPKIVRLRMRPGNAVSDTSTPMVVETFDERLELDLREDEDAVYLDGGDLQLKVRREPWQLTLIGADGEAVFDTRPVDIDGLRRVPKEQWKEQWNPNETRWIFLYRYAYPLGTVRYGDRVAAFASFALSHDERIYGFGEGFGPLMKNGTRQQLWLQEAFSNTSPAAYTQVPFYLSSRGYGLFVNTSNALAFNVGNLDHTALSVIVEDTSELDFYIIYGPKPADILAGYTSITGRAAVPPKWSFGLWMSRITYESQAEVEQVARAIRRHNIPCDVIHIDSGWFKENFVCDLQFSPERFPDPAGMFARLAEQGFKVSLWQWPNAHVGSQLFEEGAARGYLAKRASGHTYVFPGGYGEDAGIIDYSNPEAVDWIKQKLRTLFALGAAAIKADYGEGAPADAVYATVPGSAMHNRYALLYQRALWEATEEALGSGRAVLWSRAGWAGSQRWPVHWSGDGVARYEDLACVVRSMLSMGLSGFAFYSHDVGGFAGVPGPELNVRWAQLGLFSSHVRAHGMPPREPWEYGERAERIIRRYVELRYRLLPYLYSEAVSGASVGLPMARALLLAFPGDPVAATIDDQYMLGSVLLVAPVLDERFGRTVWLPPGTWVDYWTKQAHIGPCHIEVEAPLDTLPLYARGGTILPLGPPLQFVDERPLDPLTIELHQPTARGRYLVVQEGSAPIEVSYGLHDEMLELTVRGAPGAVEVHAYGLDVIAGEVAGRAVELASLPGGGVQAVLSSGTEQLHLRLAQDPEPV
jgi:alpha-D-xyloside xylohydrolase